METGFDYVNLKKKISFFLLNNIKYSNNNSVDIFGSSVCLSVCLSLKKKLIFLLLLVIIIGERQKNKMTQKMMAFIYFIFYFLYGWMTLMCGL